MNTKILTLLIVFVTNFRLCQGKQYDGYTLYRAVPVEKEQLKFLQNLLTQNYMNLIFWKKPSKLYEPVHCIVSLKDDELFHERCKHFGLKVEKKHDNVQELFDEQNTGQRYLRFETDTYSWNQYHKLDDIYQWLTDIVNKNPKICELIPVGRSFENRDIFALSIVRKRTKGTVIVEAGMHGNEWISTEFVTYLANHLVNFESEMTDARLTDVAKNYHWFLIPVANPDGYVYSHDRDRLWRKNRRRIDNTTYGVDLNRNFDYNFCKFGTSNITADDTYCGSQPFSEPETKALSRFILDNNVNLQYYFSFHAYGQKIIIPFGDKILHVDNYDECENYGKQAIIKIYKKYGMKYSIGNSYDTQGHKISGNSASWVKKSFHVPFVYTFLLRDTGDYGFGMPPSKITPTCEETLTAVLEIMTAQVKRLRADMFRDKAVRAGASSWLVSIVGAFWLAK